MGNEIHECEYALRGEVKQACMHIISVVLCLIVLYVL